MSSAWIRWLSGQTLARPATMSGWITVRQHGWTWQVAPELQAADNLQNAIAHGTVRKQSARRTVTRFDISGYEFFAKTFRATGVADRAREQLRGPQARWEASRIGLATTRGVPTADAVALGWSDDRWNVAESVVITRGLPGVTPLSQLRGRYEVPGEVTAIDNRDGLVDAVADLLATLHRAGLTHGDLHAGNVVVRRDSDGWRAWLIDLAALRTSSRWPFENLARLEYSLLHNVASSARRRFWRRYHSHLCTTGKATRTDALSEYQIARRHFLDRVIPAVDADWQRGHRKLLAWDRGMGLASLGREWLTEFAANVERYWTNARTDNAASAHRLMDCETPFGMQTLRLIRFPPTSTLTAQAAWQATHAALRRGVAAVVPWLCVETADAGYLVCCQPRDARPVANSNRLRTPDGRWTGLAAVEQLVPPAKRSSSARLRRAAAMMLVASLFTLSGCGWLNRKETTGLPVRHTVKAEQLVVQSDIRLPKSHPLIKDLEALRQDISHTLRLPLQEQPVTVYLFADELRYAQYLQTAFPNLPPRRAYFVGTPEELAVYTFWGEKIREDLRHEYTHGVLHATLKDVPLWLDEGLAEYFEVATQPRGMNGEYVTKLADALSNGWQPDLRRLEQMDSVSQMQKGDYLEAWAWVHFLLHDGDAGREVLLGYLAELRENPQPGRLSERLIAAIPAADERFRGYAATLKPDIRTVSETARGQTP